MSIKQDVVVGTPVAAPRGVETNGLNTIGEAERTGRPRSLFWPWFAANISVLGISYGSFVLGFGISFVQAAVVSVVGVVASFFFCGVISLAGKRASAPTMVISRASFGVNGNRLPSAISWLLTVGWETVLTSLAVLATSTVLTQLGVGGGTLTKVVTLIVVAAVVVVSGVFGFTIIMRLQVLISIATAVLTVVFVIVAARHIDTATVFAIPPAALPPVIGAFVLMLTGFGLGWVNAAADYSRYLPRTASGAGVIGWTTLGAAIGPAVLVVVGLLLAGSSADLSKAIGQDPIGALASLLPTWFLVPFAIVAVLGLIGGAALDIYSSGLALLSLGLRAPRYVAAAIDGVLMISGSIYIVFFSDSFVITFQGFLITLGVPIAVWCGIFLADVLLRRRDYAEADLYRTSGRYGSVRWLAVALMVIGSVVGWGLVTNSYAAWLTWQGYLLGPFGLGGTDGAWAYANLGVLAALLIGFGGTLLLGRAAVHRQEQQPARAA